MVDQIHELDLNTSFTSDNYLFGAIKLTKNTYSNIYGCNGCGIEVDASSEFSLSSGENGKNGIIFISAL